MINNKIKRVLSLLLVISIIFAIAGCGDASQPENTDSKPESVLSSSDNNNSSDIESVVSTNSDTNSESSNNSTSNIVKTTTELKSGVVTINIDNTNAITTGFDGIGGVYHYSSFGGDMLGADPYNEKQIAYEIDNIKKTGVKYIRTYFNEEMPYDSATKTLNWDSENMKPFYNYLDAMQKAKIDVAVNFGWWLSALGGKDLVRQNVAVFKEMSGSSNFDDCVPYFAKFYSEFVKEVVVKRGYSCVKYGLLFTEPNNNGMSDAEAQSKELFDKWLMAAKALDAQLKADGVREKIKLVGPNSTVNAPKWIEYAVKYANDILDIFSCHNYVRLSDWYDESGYYSQAEWALQAKEAVKPTGKPFWCDESNCYMPEQGLAVKDTTNVEYTEKSVNHPLAGTQLALNAVTCLNNGIDGFLVWSLATQKYVNTLTTNSDSFFEGVQYTGLLPYLHTSNTPRYAWYAYSMLASALNHPNQSVYAVKPKRKIYSLMAESSDGTKTIVAINTGLMETDVRFNLKEAFGGKTVYRYVYNPATIKPTTKTERINVCGVYKNVTISFDDTIPSNAVVVYTTTKY